MLMWLLIALLQAIPLRYGDVVQGTITDEQPAMVYRFTGAVNDLIVIEMRSVDRSLDNKLHTPVLILRDSSGNVLADTTLQYTLDDAVLIAQLPYTGVYDVIATRDELLDYKAVGDYTLSLNRIPRMLPDEPLMIDLLYTDIVYYAIWMTDDSFVLDYQHLIGDFHPVVTVNQLIPERGGLRAVGMIYGRSMTQAAMTISGDERFYILTLAQSPLDYVFDEASGSVILTLMNGGGYRQS
ncbi:MAG: hypothetical protein Kow00117_16700 [Phototrophicales bacterium]|nr:MAG: hypothetical protein CUN56_03100 [Phototrophicales bacterium]RMG72589.1 MAG: hypothetical protein D6711_12640 [Chloroflexota bacterium]